MLFPELMSDEEVWRVFKVDVRGLAVSQPIYRNKRPLQCINDIVSAEFGFSVGALRGDRQYRDLAYARHVAMWLAMETTEYSLQRIGDYYNRHHTTVMHAGRRLRAQRNSGGVIRVMTDKLRRIAREQLAG